MKKYRFVLLVLLLTGTVHTASVAATVAVSIQPLHSLVQGVMGETAEAGLVLKGNASPHGFSLKPSQVKMLHEADIVFYIDDTFESFLRNTLSALPPEARSYAVAREAGVKILKTRSEGLWEGHSHHDEHHHDDYPHGRHDDDDDDAHRHTGGGDMHLWLDIGNAKKIVRFVADTLGEAEPRHQAVYAANAERLMQRLDSLDAKLTAKLAGVRARPFIVLHDAYQYFERRYDLSGMGSLMLEPDQSPSVSRVQAIRDKIHQTGSVCVFREPQFSRRLIDTVIQGSRAESGVLDPLGAGLHPGPDLYFELLENLAQGFVQCLSRHE